MGEPRSRAPARTGGGVGDGSSRCSATVNPRTVSLENLSGWRKAIEETVSLREAHRCLKIWRALWKVAAALGYCVRDADPSLGVRNRAAPGRNLQWTEGEVVRVAKRAWRMGYYGLAAVIAVAWDTQLSPGDVRALRASQMARGADWKCVFHRAGQDRHAGRRILSTRSLAVLSAYLERLGVELHGDAYIFRNRSGPLFAAIPWATTSATCAASTSATWNGAPSADFRRYRRRRGDHRRRQGRTAGARHGQHALSASNALFATYVPVNQATLRTCWRRAGGAEANSDENSTRPQP